MLLVVCCSVREFAGRSVCRSEFAQSFKSIVIVGSGHDDLVYRATRTDQPNMKSPQAVIQLPATRTTIRAQADRTEAICPGRPLFSLPVDLHRAGGQRLWAPFRLAQLIIHLPCVRISCRIVLVGLKVLYTPAHTRSYAIKHGPFLAVRTMKSVG